MEAALATLERHADTQMAQSGTEWGWPEAGLLRLLRLMRLWVPITSLI